jgi:hypothetical protein
MAVLADMRGWKPREINMWNHLTPPPSPPHTPRILLSRQTNLSNTMRAKWRIIALISTLALLSGVELADSSLADERPRKGCEPVDFIKLLEITARGEETVTSS